MYKKSNYTSDVLCIKRKTVGPFYSLLEYSTQQNKMAYIEFVEVDDLTILFILR